MPERTRKRGGGKVGKSKKSIRKTIRSIRKVKNVQSTYPDVLAKHLESALLKIIKTYNSTESGLLQSEISALSATIIGQVYEDMTPEKVKNVRNNDNIGKLLNMFGSMEINNNKNNSNNNLNVEELAEEALEDPVGSLYTLTQLIHKLRKKYINEKNEEKSNKYGLFIILLAESIQKGIDEYTRPVDNPDMDELLSRLGTLVI